MRARRLAWAAVATCAVLGGWAPGATAEQTVTTAGPIETLWVSDDLACQVSFINGGTFEFFPPDVAPGDCGALVAVDGVLYAPDFEERPTAVDELKAPAFLAPVSERQSGTGTAADPYVLTTEVTAGDISISQKLSYVTGQYGFRVDITARNPSSAPHDVKVYFAGDCYASGSDIGYGFRRPEIRSIGCSQAPHNTPAGRTIQLTPLTPGSRGIEDFYANVWGRIGDLETFDDTCRCDESIDNGVALQWVGRLAGAQTQTFSVQVSLTESGGPPNLADSDGDALPDVWETGQGASLDAENLAALGADPARKDIFVHADWMEGCQPPTGWEAPAIAEFGRHGIALHVDSGPDSNNFDGTWGDRSRAGAVRRIGTLSRSSVWQSVDDAKDAHFVPSGRRRAFHYVLFADWIDGDTALGISRGIPDSDVIIANCGHPGRADLTFFVHELGHNLGLRHGGDEDRFAKPNYYSVMNYGWARWALANPTRYVPYSEIAQPGVNEQLLDERAGLRSPSFWHCPNDAATFPSKRDFTPGPVLPLEDLNCNHVWGERGVQADLDKSGALDAYNGFNDWAALQFRGGGVIGAVALPARPPDPPVVPEFGSQEIAQQIASEQEAARLAARTLVISSKTTQVRYPWKATSRTTVKVTVTSAPGVAVGQAKLRVRGATLARGRKSRRTDTRGQATLKFRTRSTRQLRIVAARGGYDSATLLIDVNDTRRTMRTTTRTKRVRRGRRQISVRVTSSGRSVRNATIRVSGATLARGRKSRRTDRRGRATLTMKVRSRRAVRVTITRTGYKPVTLRIPVRR